VKNDQIKEWLETEKGRKIILASFLFLSFGVIVYGFTSLTHKMKEPFGEKTGWQEYSDQKQAQEIALLKMTDTDEDGLTDFDEKFIYMTSLYIKDSDSDGMGDAQEVQVGTDPWCPAGENCGYVDLSELNLSSESASQVLTPDEIRVALVGAGISEDLLLEVDDETLLQIYQETIDEVETVDTTTPDLQTDLSYTAEEIRKFFISAGIDQVAVNAVSDADLVSSYYKTVDELGYDPIELQDDQVLGSYVDAMITDGDGTSNQNVSAQDLLELRQFFVTSGISQADVDALTDEEILAIINSTQL
jgi:hypothetical protein